MKSSERIARLEKFFSNVEFLKPYRFVITMDSNDEPVVTFDSISNESMKKLVKLLNGADLRHITVEDKSRKGVERGTKRST